MYTDFFRSKVALAALVAIFTAGNVSAQVVSAPGQASTQLKAKVATTYIVRFDSSIDPSLYRRNAASLATRFRGQVIHTYENVLPGFAVRINGDNGANLLGAAGQFGIASVTRDVLVSINTNGTKGPNATAKPCFVTNTCPPPDGGGGGETIGWNIARVTDGNRDSFSGSVIKGTTSGISACVIDTGIKPDHEDLNVVGGTSIIGASPDDDNGHGTHVAGTIGAIANTVGVVGVAPGVKVVPVKVLDSSGSGALSDVVDGIDWAAANCTIANLSLGASASTTIMDDAVTCATGVTPGNYPDNSCKDNSLLVTIAAGNSAVDIIAGSYTPARASVGPSDNIFTIASIAQGDEWSSFSNYNVDPEHRVDFALPGQSILSTWNDGAYATISGTSMAAPHMAGLLVRYLADVGAGALDNTKFVRGDTLNLKRTSEERIKEGRGKPKVTVEEHEIYDIIDLPFPTP